MINQWGTNMQTRALYTEREKVLRGGYGQQSDYEAEMINSFLILSGLRLGNTLDWNKLPG